MLSVFMIWSPSLIEDLNAIPKFINEFTVSASIALMLIFYVLALVIEGYRHSFDIVKLPCGAIAIDMIRVANREAGSRLVKIRAETALCGTLTVGWVPVANPMYCENHRTGAGVCQSVGWRRN